MTQFANKTGESHGREAGPSRFTSPAIKSRVISRCKTNWNETVDIPEQCEQTVADLSFFPRSWRYGFIYTGRIGDTGGTYDDDDVVDDDENALLSAEMPFWYFC